MGKSTLTIEIPHMSDEVVASLQHMLCELAHAFEAQYYQQLQRYYEQSSDELYFNESIELDDPPF